MWLNRIRLKDDYVYSHSLGTAVWALALGRHLNLDRDTLKAVGLGAMLLDVGKTRVKTELLQKTGALTPEEHAELRRHVEYGLEIVNSVTGVDASVVTMIAGHHERFDGKGYPNGIAGEDIPLVSRIGSIVDCYDAMISVRAYAKQVSTYDAIRELNRLSGTWFHPEMVEQLIQAIGVFPTGTLVQLNTGEVGVVVGQSPFRRMRPEVMLLLDADKQLRTEFTTIDLQSQQNGKDGPAVWIERGLEPGAFGLDPAEYFL
jgi:HD-GYP domain-containing protein (c-di-GMP phosphodiesterase class II)